LQLSFMGFILSSTVRLKSLVILFFSFRNFLCFGEVIISHILCNKTDNAKLFLIFFLFSKYFSKKSQHFICFIPFKEIRFSLFLSTTKCHSNILHCAICINFIFLLKFLCYLFTNSKMCAIIDLGTKFPTPKLKEEQL